MSPLPQDAVDAVRAWCAVRVPAHARHQVFVECQVTDRHLTIVERRLPYTAHRDDGTVDAVPEEEWTRLPVARLHYTRARAKWELYWRDRNLRFHRHDQIPATPVVTDLLAAIDRTAAASSSADLIFARTARTACDEPSQGGHDPTAPEPGSAPGGR